jgi:hypothetical protein
LSFSSPQLLRLPLTSAGFSGPQALAFSTSKVNGRRHSLKWEAVGHGAWERAFVPPQYLCTGCEAPPTAADRRQTFFDGREPSCFLGAESVRTLRNHDGYDIAGCGQSTGAGRFVAGPSRFRFPKYINLTSATASEGQPSRNLGRGPRR